VGAAMDKLASVFTSIVP